MAKKNPSVRCGCSADHKPATGCDAIICSCGNEPHKDGFATVALKPGRGWIEAEPTKGGLWKGHIQCASCGAIFDEQAAFCGTAAILMGTADEDEEDAMDEEDVVEALMDLFDNEEAVRESDLGEALSRKPAETFKQAGILTRDEGLVLRMKDGRRLFLTVQIQEGR